MCACPCAWKCVCVSYSPHLFSLHDYVSPFTHTFLIHSGCIFGHCMMRERRQSQSLDCGGQNLSLHSPEGGFPVSGFHHGTTSQLRVSWLFCASCNIQCILLLRKPFFKKWCLIHDSHGGHVAEGPKIKTKREQGMFVIHYYQALIKLQRNVLFDYFQTKARFPIINLRPWSLDNCYCAINSYNDIKK